jgi:hypothetical protein
MPVWWWPRHKALAAGSQQKCIQYGQKIKQKKRIPKPRLEGLAWAFNISSLAQDKGLNGAWAWLGLCFLGQGMAGLGLSGPACPSLRPSDQGMMFLY